MTARRGRALFFHVGGGRAGGRALVFGETGVGVVDMFSGSLDLTGATGAGISNVSQPQMTPTLATIFSGADFTLEVDLYEIV